MALNKSQTSTGVKVVLIVLIIAFVASFISLGAGLFSGGGDTGTTATGNDPVSQANAQFQPTVSALTAQLQSEPTSYTALVSLGNTYFDWAATVQQAAQATTSAVGADQPLWVAAKDAYRRALDVQKGEPPVRIDYAITLFYTGETDRAVALATKVTEDTPDYAPAYFNLGIFNGALGQNAAAVAAFSKALELDPDGKQINADVAKQRLSELSASAETSPTP